MSTKVKLLIASFCVVVALFGAFYVGRVVETRMGRSGNITTTKAGAPSPGALPLRVEPRAPTPRTPTSTPPSATTLVARVVELCSNSLRAYYDTDSIVELAKVTEGRTVEELYAALVAVEKDIPRDKRWQARSTLLSKLAEADPAAALGFAETLPRSDKQYVLSIIGAAWAKKDPNAALGWLASLPKNHERESVLSSIIAVISEADPERAVDIAEYYRGAASSSQWGWGYGGAYGKWAQTAPQKAIDRASRIPNAQQRSQAYQNIATE